MNKKEQEAADALLETLIRSPSPVEKKQLSEAYQALMQGVLNRENATMIEPTKGK